MWLLGLGVALAATPDAVDLWEAFLARGDATASGERPFDCHLGLVAEIEAHWSEFDPAQQAALTEAFAPFKASLVDPMPQAAWTGLDGPDGLDVGGPKLFAGSDTCWGQQGSNRVLTEHFSVEWDSASVGMATATAFGEALEKSWEEEFGPMGWKEPDGSNNYKIMAFISGDNYASAYTTVSACGSVYMPYIVAGRGSFSSGVWYQDMAGHELNHASQYAYSVQFLNEGGLWLYEATATYTQDQIWPTHEIWSQYTSGYADHPGIAMAASDQEDQTIFYHMYGMNIWLFWLDENGMGPDGARQQWEQVEENERFGDRTEVDLLTDLGFDFYELYKGFMAANTVMDYRQRRYHPEIDVEDYVDELPAEGGASGSQTPQQHGQHYIQLADRAFDAELPNLDVSFDGRVGGEWIALLVGASDDEVQMIVEVPLDDGLGDGQLEDWGQYDEVWLVVSPTSDAGEDWSYDWTLAASAPPEPEPEPEDTDAPLDSGEQPTLIGCGCAPGTGPSPAFGIAGLLALVISRRRRE